MQLSEALSLAISHQNAGRDQAAAEIYDRILDVDPGNPPAATLRARIHLKQGTLQDADRLTALAVRTAPDFMQAWNARGDILDARDKPEAASDAWRRSLVTGPGNTGPFVGVGNQFQLQGDHVQAVMLDAQSGARREGRFVGDGPGAGALSDACPGNRISLHLS